MIENINISCYGCGASVFKTDNVCKFCGNPVTITTFTSANNMSAPLLNKYIDSYKKINKDDNEATMAIAFCYLKLRNYDKANQSFETAMEGNMENSEVLFYAAVSMLKGKKPFLAQREIIDKVIDYLQAAISIESREIYYYFLAYVKYDYFKRKGYRVTPDYKDEMNKALSGVLTNNDIEQLFELLHVEKPIDM